MLRTFKALLRRLGSPTSAIGSLGGRRQPARRPGISLQLESLEDRLALSTAATQFLILTPRSAEANQPAEIEVVALDASNHHVSNYTGTIQLSSSDTATTLGSTALPTTYTFTARDHGEHEFLLTPGVAGSETITASDTATTALTGSAVLQVNPAPVATHLLVITARSSDAGVAAPVAVEALDASNHIVPNYTGTIQLSSSDSATTLGATALPTTYTFTARDHGFHLFSVTPGATGTETITASDTTTTSITGSAALLVNPAPVATHFAVVVPKKVEAGVATPVVVEALDASNHLVPNYAGTIQLSGSDTAATLAGATLPATYTFSATDHGFHVFSVDFSATGSDTVTVAATTGTPALTGSAVFTVGTKPSFPSYSGDYWRLAESLSDRVFQHSHGR